MTFTLNSAVMAVGLGNYGRLGDQRRYTDDNARLMLARPDEQPGAMPEIAPSPEGRAIDAPFNEQLMVMQAWANYGTLWPVAHQQLGLRPDLGFGRLEVVPQLPPGQDHIATSNILVGAGTVGVTAMHRATTYTTSSMHEFARGSRSGSPCLRTHGFAPSN